MKFRNYKQLLEQISQSKQIFLTISLWTYNSKRMVFKVPFEQIKQYLDQDIIFKYGVHKLKFTSNGEQFSFLMDKLRIAKVDYIEID